MGIFGRKRSNGKPIGKAPSLFSELKRFLRGKTPHENDEWHKRRYNETHFPSGKVPWRKP
jgi:hypothetical protein